MPHSLDSAAAEDSSVDNINQKLTPILPAASAPSLQDEKMAEAESSQDWTSRAAISLSTYYLRFMHDAAGSAQ